jgi:hypothetical protein
MRRFFRAPVRAKRERRWLVRRGRDDEANERDDAILTIGGEEKQVSAR